MTPDEMKELRELVEFLKENGLNEFEFERGDLKIRLKFAQPVAGGACFGSRSCPPGAVVESGWARSAFRLSGNPRRGFLGIGVGRCASGGSSG